MLSRTVETFLSEYYDEIVTMSSKICRGHRDHLDVAHYCIADFAVHDRAEELIDANRAMNFLSGMIHRSFNSSTSPYHKLYRQSGRVHANGNNDQSHKAFHTRKQEDYDHSIDFMTEAILGVLEEMKVSGDKDIWYMAVLFEMWLDNPNYSELSRKTQIPRTSISQAVQQCREYVQEQLKQRGITL